MRLIFRFTLALAALISAHAADTPPQVTVSNIRRVFHNGEHNAFTDLCRFRDQLYLAFRSCPDGHPVSPTASVIILRSKDDGATWEQVHRFAVKERDTRDPHFLIFRDRLFVYAGTWWSGETILPREEYDINQHLGYAVWSEDGTKWSEPTMLEGTFGHYIWRAAAHGGKAYLCGRRKTEFAVKGGGLQSAMLESDDGLVWKTRSLFSETGGNETAFLFENDGSVLAIDRHRDPSQLIRAKPPYTDWTRLPLDRFVGGPLIVKWGDHYLVGGRRKTEKGPKTSLCWLVGDALREFAELPSSGDNSYPGFAALSPTRGLVSYYSSHEKDAEGRAITAIYLAELHLGSK